MRQYPHDMVKKICFMIFPHSIDSVSMDISIYRIGIIDIENNLSIYPIAENKPRNNDIHSLSQQDIWASFGHQKPSKFTPQDTHFL